ncbi:MAG: hypothetical protein LBU89_03945 [Fibromonadaceae bacterium]|jgi:cell division protein FtsL|nr:hypothetical protein [Fibromonadaceae bacterium]
MKLIITSIFLFCMLFVLAIPMKMANEKLAHLIHEEKILEDSVSVMRFEVSLVDRSIDSLSSRNRIDSIAPSLGLGMNEVATKITRVLK